MNRISDIAPRHPRPARFIAPVIKAALLLLFFPIIPASASEPSVSSASPTFEVMHRGGAEPLASVADGEDMLCWMAPPGPRRTLGRASESRPAAVRFPTSRRRETHSLYRGGTRLRVLVERSSLPLLL